jgi:hypothetical protein
VQLRHVVDDRDGLADARKGLDELLQRGNLFQRGRIGDAVLAPGFHHDEEGGGAGQRPIDILHALADRRALRKVADEVGIHLQGGPAPERSDRQRGEDGRDGNAMPQDVIARDGESSLERRARR